MASSEKTSIEFPGQGAPYGELIKDLSDPNVVGKEASEVAQEVFEEVQDEVGVDLQRLVTEHTIEELADTRVAQILLLAAGYAGGRILLRKKVNPDYYRGHSASAFTAAGLAGALALRSASRLMVKRGQHMHEAAQKHPGGVAVTDLALEKLIEICDTTGSYIANLNSPIQTVISGSIESLAQAKILIKQSGGRATIFRDWKNGPVHSPIIQEAEDKLRQDLKAETVSDTNIQFVKNTDGQITDKAEEVRDDLGGMAKQVRWTDGTMQLLANGVTRFIEVGPRSKKVLTGMLKEHGLEGIVKIEHFFDNI